MLINRVAKERVWPHFYASLDNSQSVGCRENCTSLPSLFSLCNAVLGDLDVYLEPWHADIFEFLDIIKNHGKV